MVQAKDLHLFLIKFYKALSIKYNYGLPVTISDLYYGTVIDIIKRSYDTREVKRAITLWKKSFQKCIDTLPRSKKFVQYYWAYADGFFDVIITGQYICGFEVCYSKNTAVLNYDNGNESIKEEFTIYTFNELCNRADTLIDSEFGIFKEMSETYLTIKDALTFYKEHITSRTNGETYDYLCDNKVVYSGICGISSPSQDAKSWKI